MTHLRMTIFAALLLLISCKQDPLPVTPSNDGNDSITPTDSIVSNDSITPGGTIIVPEIHSFMPGTLLNLFGEENIHQGNTPPDISGSWLADNMFISEVHYADTTLDIHTIVSGNFSGATYFSFRDLGQNNMNAEYFIKHSSQITSYVDYSNMDSTALILQNHPNLMTSNPLLPSHFQVNSFDFSLLNKAYITGTGDQFTVYFYEIMLNQIPENLHFFINDFHPVSAKIISGKALRDQNGNITGIADFRIGQEVVGYAKDNETVHQLIQLGSQPTPGDAWIKTNQGIDLTPETFQWE